MSECSSGDLAMPEMAFLTVETKSVSEKSPEFPKMFLFGASIMQIEGKLS